MSAVGLYGLHKSYGAPALDNFSLQIEAGSFTVIAGSAQSGKSTLFRLLTGLEQPDHGRIELHGEDITELPAGGRKIGYVPQSFALYPHYDVRKNIAYPLLLAGAPATEIKRDVDRAAGMLSITHLLDKTPDQLSGGEKQRTALARGLMRKASVFVLDDPLVGLDYKLREQLMDDLKDLRAELDATFVYGTSDPIEALTMASQLVLLDRGKSVQAGTPEEVYRRPACARAMELVGFPRANMLASEQPFGAKLVSTLPGLNGSAANGGFVLGVRPEAVRLVDAGDAQLGVATVQLVEDLGSEIIVHLQAGQSAVTAAFGVGAQDVPHIGAQVGVAIDPAAVALFDTATGVARTFQGGADG